MRHIGGTLETSTLLWRYMRPERFVSMLDESKLYFAAASQFDDKFEGAISVEPPELARDPRSRPRDITDNAFKELTRLTKVSCWHMAEFESDAMWQLYAADGKGVAVRTTVGKLIESLRPFRLKPEFGEEEVWSGRVRYIDLLSEKVKASMLERFFFKHRAFEWEREFRLVVSLRLAEEYGCSIPEEGVKVVYDPKTLIGRVVCGPHLAETERAAITEACTRADIAERIVESSTLGTPRYS